MEFESPEALLLAFDEAIHRCRQDQKESQIFQIGNQHFDAYSFKDYDSMEYALPAIYTLEEWFDRYSKS